MKKVKILALLVMCMLMSLMIVSCSKKNENSSSEESSSIVSKSESSKPEDSSISESSLLSKDNSSEIESTGSETSEVQVTPEEVLDTLPEIETGSDEFKEDFKQNDIDKSYAESAGGTYSVTEMKQLISDTVEKWKSYIDVVYAQALETASSDTEKETIKSEQEKWVSEIDGKIEEISTSAQGGGSQASLDASAKIMSLYRDRAAELCNIVYTNTGSIPSFDDVEAGPQG